MPSSAILLLSGIAAAALLGVIAWRRQRGPGSAARSVEAFRGAMRAIQPRERDRRR